MSGLPTAALVHLTCATTFRPTTSMPPSEDPPVMRASLYPNKHTAAAATRSASRQSLMPDAEPAVARLDPHHEALRAALKRINDHLERAGSQKCQSDGAGPHAGSGAHPGGGTNPSGGFGQPGGATNRTRATSRTLRCLRRTPPGRCVRGRSLTRGPTPPTASTVRRRPRCGSRQGRPACRAVDPGEPQPLLQQLGALRPGEAGGWRIVRRVVGAPQPAPVSDAALCACRRHSSERTLREAGRLVRLGAAATGAGRPPDQAGRRRGRRAFVVAKPGCGLGLGSPRLSRSWMRSSR